MTFKASRNLGQALGKADSSFITFEASAVSLVQEQEREGWGEENISTSSLKHDQRQDVPAL